MSVPTIWPTQRAKWLLERQSRPPRPHDGVVTAFRDGQVTLRANRRLDGFTEAVQEIGYQGIRKGDLVVHSMDGFAGAIGVSDSDGKASPVVHAYRVSDGTDPRFAAYVLRTMASSGYIESLAKGIRERSTSFDVATLANLQLPCPPVNEQRRIAEFLDAETVRIDQLITAQLQVLELLEERANTRILELIGKSLLVTEGGTAIVPMRRVIKKINRPVFLSEEIITAFRDGQVTSRSLRRNEGFTLSASAEPQGQGVEVGDIVIHGLDGFAGAIGDSEASGNCSPVYHVCIPIDAGNPTYYGRLLRLLALNGYLALYGASARERAVDFRNWQLFGSARVPIAEPTLQHVIGTQITKIRPLREEVKRFTERLTERRQALITAAVTGQIDVTTAERVTL
jgi:type I restriction enzyme, S subunit